MFYAISTILQPCNGHSLDWISTWDFNDCFQTRTSFPVYFFCFNTSNTASLKCPSQMLLAAQVIHILLTVWALSWVTSFPASPLWPQFVLHSPNRSIFSKKCTREKQHDGTSMADIRTLQGVLVMRSEKIRHLQQDSATQTSITSFWGNFTELVKVVSLQVISIHIRIFYASMDRIVNGRFDRIKMHTTLQYSPVLYSRTCPRRPVSVRSSNHFCQLGDISLNLRTVKGNMGYSSWYPSYLYCPPLEQCKTVVRSRVIQQWSSDALSLLPSQSLDVMLTLGADAYFIKHHWQLRSRRRHSWFTVHILRLQLLYDPPRNACLHTPCP